MGRTARFFLRSLRRRVSLLITVLAASLLLLVSCRPAPPPPHHAASTVAERGPLKLSVFSMPGNVWIGDPITIDVVMQTPSGYIVEMPGSEALGALEVTKMDAPEPKPGASDFLEWRRTFTIQTTVSGPIEIPPLAVRYGRKSADPAAEPVFDNELISEPLIVEVRSALTTQDSVEQPREITGVLAAPPRKRSALEWALLATITGFMAVAGYFAYRLIRERMHRPAPPVAPEVLAMRALRELERLGLHTVGRMREFYYQLNEIVRQFIERKFDLRAPEMTTEEFLGSLSADRGVLPGDPTFLKAFLEACDLVKYAAYEPLPEDAQSALETARAFVNSSAAAAATRQDG